ncbi:hypothetical protein DFJ73DRAFT_631499, partial [Zopfochytrium polystomum]
LPLTRIRSIAKEDWDISTLGNEACVAISAATVAFMEVFAGEVAKRVAEDKRRSVTYKDVVRTVKGVEKLQFLEDIIPDKMKLGEALEEQKKFRAAVARKK